MITNPDCPVCTSPNLSGMSGGGTFSDRRFKSTELTELFEKEERRLNKKKVEIELWIQTIFDSTTRDIFRLRYIRGLTWGKVEREIPYSRRQIVRIHNRVYDTLPD